MSRSVIKVEGLSKQYRIGVRERHDMLRESLVHAVKAPFQRLKRIGKPLPEKETIWALKDVSFEVQEGEVIGIIGRNGAGKSTLLKILSRITKPTEGNAKIHGRVGSLLEVGTGFHPELTGRENIYLNGAILGMKKKEIERKFDEIVNFAEVEKFIDTPVKRYSSGMYVRLAFAVAAHLEPEILLVDEVLSVGDAAFQKKCLGKMGDVATEGRTVLFVSHNMVAVQSLCGRGICLNDGKIVGEGQANQVVSNYLKRSFSTSMTEQMWDDIATAPGNDMVRLRRVCARPVNGSPSNQITMQTPLVIEVEYRNLVPDACLNTTLHLYTEQGVIAFSTGNIVDSTWRNRPFPVGLFRSICHIPGNLLNSGMHRVLVLVVKDLSSIIYRHEDAVSFEVVDVAERQELGWYGKEPGVVQPMLEWTTEYLDSGPEVTLLANESSAVLCPKQ